MLGLIAGSYVGGILSQASRNVRVHTGWCLLPKAGIALGLALSVSEHYPALASQVRSIVTGTTIVLELIGPIVTRLALQHAGEVADEE